MTDEWLDIVVRLKRLGVKFGQVHALLMDCGADDALLRAADQAWKTAPGRDTQTITADEVGALPPGIID